MLQKWVWFCFHGNTAENVLNISYKQLESSCGVKVQRYVLIPRKYTVQRKYQIPTNETTVMLFYTPLNSQGSGNS